MTEEKKPMTRSELEIIIKRRAAVLLIILAALVAVNSFFKDGNSGRIMKDIIAANNQWAWYQAKNVDRKSTRLNSSHIPLSRMPSSA